MVSVTNPATINNANQTDNKQAELANAILMTEDKSALVQFMRLLWLVVEFVLFLVVATISNANNQTAKQEEVTNAILMTEDKSALVQFTQLI
jgi:hypothetical protein